MTNAVATLTSRALGEFCRVPLDNYTALLAEACAATDPPYGRGWYGDRYREVAGDADWFVGSLVDNAVVEGDGSRKLWELAARCADPAVSRLVRRHAIDESNHAQYYTRIIDVLFPGAISDEVRPAVSAVSPHFGDDSVLPDGLPPKSEAHVLDELVQMNIGEIRTRIHQLLLRPVSRAYCPDGGATELEAVLDRLLADETKHIAYTARLIEAACTSGRRAEVADLMQRRMADFNDITLREIGADVFDGC